MSGTLWITGVGGFTGYHLVQHVRCDKDPPRIVGLDLLCDPPMGVDAYYAVDLTEPDAVRAALRNYPPDWVIHLAGVMPPVDDTSLWQVNVGGTLRLIRQLASSPVARSVRILGVGSAAEYLPPSEGPLTEESACLGTGPYGETKWLQSMLTLAMGKQLKVLTLVTRTFNLVGPGLPARFLAGSLCEQFCKTETKEVRVGSLSPRRDYVDVRDAARAYWLLVRRGCAGEVYNVCRGTPTSVRDVLELLSEITGRRPLIVAEPARTRAHDPEQMYGSNAKILAAVGWAPMLSLRKSLVDMLGRRPA